MDTSVHTATTAIERNAGRYRWVICGMLFLATVINYMDRQILGLLAPMLQHDIGWSQLEYSRIVITFSAAYAVGILLAGRIVDRLGVKLSYSLAILFWSAAAMLHAAVSTVVGFAVVRALLGLGEGGHFPAAIKTVAEWFAPKERALAVGLFNSGANIGAVIAPAVIPALALAYGWRAAFVIIGLLGIAWFVAWLFVYRPADKSASEPHETPAVELPQTQASPAPTWRTLLTYRQTWAFIVGKFLTDPIWWFYLFWLPKWLNEARGLDMRQLGLPLLTIYTITIVGSIGGGWLSSTLLRRGKTVNRARKTAMLVCALCAVPVMTVSGIDHLWLAVFTIGLAAAAHQGWSANLFTTVSDLFPQRMVASVIGLGGMAGSLGGVLFSEVIGRVLERSGHYWSLFAIGGSAYLVAFVAFHLLSPRMEAAKIAQH
ncbi:MFS transporter [Lysobacter sp. CA199]|uniref:MFS transporter n=1 Tax=Lysobacter sp. CA199 TaxID=3455608 RepID=UPI003F8D8CBB